MRVLALDYGRARCGCAVSDPTGVLATPIDPVSAPASRRGLARLRSLVAELPRLLSADGACAFRVRERHLDFFHGAQMPAVPSVVVGRNRSTRDATYLNVATCSLA